MKLYNHQGQWQLPGQQDKKAAKLDVPTSAPDLCAFLNARQVSFDPVSYSAGEPKDEDPMGDGSDYGVTPIVDKPIHHVEHVTGALSVTDISDVEDFILNRASVAQVENLFARLGTRFAELRSN